MELSLLHKSTAATGKLTLTAKLWTYFKSEFKFFFFLLKSVDESAFAVSIETLTVEETFSSPLVDFRAVFFSLATATLKTSA